MLLNAMFVADYSVPANEMRKDGFNVANVESGLMKYVLTSAQQVWNSFAVTFVCKLLAWYFYASATVEKRYRRHTVTGSVRL